ncbi:MAG: hypothetical protein QM723_27650 [Myxococcaceae bacterium]
MSAVELRGNVAAQAAATLGVKDVAGGFVGAGVKEEMAVRVDLSHPPQVSVRTDISGNVSGSVGLNVTNGKQGNDNNTGSMAFGGGKAEGKVSIEQRFTLPEGEGAELLADPVGTLKADAGKIQRTEQDKVTFTLDASGGAMGSGGGMLTTVTMNTSPGEIAKSGAMKDAVRQGRPARSAAAAGQCDERDGDGGAVPDVRGVDVSVDLGDGLRGGGVGGGDPAADGEDSGLAVPGAGWEGHGVSGVRRPRGADEEGGAVRQASAAPGADSGVVPVSALPYPASLDRP